jgi:hypothetical protein
VTEAARDPLFRCSVGAADEPMAGSAAVATTYLLVEHPGPWGRKALAESRFPESVRHGLAEAADAAGVRVQLIRRTGRGGTDGIRVFVGYAAPGAERVLTRLLDDPGQLLDLDLAAFAGGDDQGWAVHDGPLYLVCTNGRRDLCCAELGRPIVGALAAAYPDETWETTHVGGHRFAGALVVLPEGLSYGRLDPGSVLDVVALHRRGALSLDHLRGRSAYAGPVQAAEVAALRRLGATTTDALRLVETRSDGPLTTVTFEQVSGERIEIRVETRPTAPARQSCADLTPKPGTTHHVDPS